MMRYLICFICLFLLGLSPIQPKRDTLEKADVEFTNIYLHAQDEQFTIRNSTPVPSTLKDGQAVILSTDVVRLIFRVGQELYSVELSCITVHR